MFIHTATGVTVSMHARSPPRAQRRVTVHTQVSGWLTQCTPRMLDFAKCGAFEVVAHSWTSDKCLLHELVNG